MLVVETKIAPSLIHGNGCFAATPIKKGELIWRYLPGLDIALPRWTVNQLPPLNRAHFLNHGYINPKNRGVVILPFDNAQFMNFSFEPTTIEQWDAGSSEALLVAARDIDPGEELTVPISSDADAPRKLRSVPNAPLQSAEICEICG